MQSFGRGWNLAPTTANQPTFKVSSTFSKVVESKGKAFGRPAHRAKFFFTRKRRRGGETVRRTVLPWGTLAGGSPVPPGTPNSSRKFARVLLISPDISFVNAFVNRACPVSAMIPDSTYPKIRKPPFRKIAERGLFCFIPECRGFSAVCRNRPANLRRSECNRALCRP